MNWLLNQLKEASTWRGLVWILTVFGIALNPEQAAAITALGMAVAGALGVFLKDQLGKPGDKNSQLPRETPELPSIDLIGHPERYAPPRTEPLESTYQPPISGTSSLRNRRATDQWVCDNVPSETGFKHPTESNRGTVGWNEDH